MKFLSSWVFLTIICCVCCLNDDVIKVEEQHEQTENREGKQLRETVKQEGWRAVNPHKWQNSDEWIPKDSSQLTSDVPNKPIQRRRRIRKRKRRPPQISSSEESQEYPQRRRRIRPQILEQVSDSWAEIEEEAPRRPYSRRRTTPVYFPEVQTEESIQVKPLYAVLHFEETSGEPPRVYEKVRDPFTALEEAEEKARLKKKQKEVEETTTLANLKTLLKQSAGSLSLSEILQKKNLSLQDLLKGKQHAIAALTENPETTTQYFTDLNETETPKNYESSNENFAQQGTTINYEVITEAITERRIFVPANFKLYSSSSYKHSMINKTAETIIKQTTRLFGVGKTETTHTTTSLSTQKHLSNKYLDYRSKYVSVRPKLKSSLPITSAKLNRIANKRPNNAETTSIPPQAFTINVKDLFGIAEVTVEPKQDGPVKMIIDIEGLMKRTTTEESPNILDDLEKVTTEIKASPETSTFYEKIKPTSAREEIMEILRDHVSRQNLSRILEMRNMTIEELVEQRERGSSQLHLADIFHNQTREPEPPSEPHVGSVFFDRKPKTIPEIKQDLLKPLELSKQNKSLDSESPKQSTPVYTVTSFPTYKIEMEKIIKHNQPPPFQLSIWKNLYPNLYTGDIEDFNQKGELDELKGSKVEDILRNDIRRVEEVENSISEAVNGQLNIDLKDNNYVEEDDYYVQLPRGVKSAIIASAAIIAISVFVFLTVFFIFKWLQKQKKRLSYSSNFSCSRIKSPILQTRPKRTIRTIMSETLGRKKRYSNVYPQSMSDYIWESDKKPFQ